jgi:type II secretory pathway component PulJ
MKTLHPWPRATARRRAFTLLELLVTMVTTVLVVGGAMAAYGYGLRTVQYVNPKLGSSDEARKAISLLTDEIRAARSLKIGSGTIASFTEVGPFAAQQGNALQVYPTVNTNAYIRYFWDSTDQQLKRTTNGTTATLVIANWVSNRTDQTIFQSQDYAGRVLSNSANNRVISMELNFYQIQYPKTPVGPGNYYDYYKLSAKFTRRTLF